MNRHRPHPVPVALVLAVLALAQDLGATTIHPETFTCPACSAKIETYTISSTNSFGGKDPDFCPHAVGASPLHAYGITCVRCLYSGSTADFAETVKLTEAERARLKTVLKPARPIEPGTRLSSVPATVTYDLVAQTRQALGKSPAEIAWPYLYASWVYRMDVSLSAALPEAERERLMSMGWELSKRVPRPDGGRRVTAREYAIHQVAAFHQMASTLDQRQRLATLLYGAERLRAHGEVERIRDLLPWLKILLPPDQYDAYATHLEETVEEERGYQRKALEWFSKAVGQEGDPAKKAELTYLVGELHRRMGDLNAARWHFDLARRMPGMPDALLGYITEQERWLPRE